MSEEVLDIKKLRSLSTSKIMDLFFDKKISKSDLKSLISKDDILKLDSATLEKVLYKQRTDKSTFPKELRISQSDIYDAYGRLLTGDNIYNLARAGLVDESILLKVYKRSRIVAVLDAVKDDNSPESDSKQKDKEEQTKNKKNDKKHKGKSKEEEPEEEEPEEEQPEEEEPEENKPEENEVPIENSINEADNTSEQLSDNEGEHIQGDSEVEEIKPNDSTLALVITDEKVKEFFSATRLLRMFLEQRLTAEFVEDFWETFKEDIKYKIDVSKRIIESLKKLFKDNLPLISSIIMRLYFKGMILLDDLRRMLEDEIFKSKMFEDYTIYDVLDKNGVVVGTYKIKKDKEHKGEQVDSVVDAEIPRYILQRALPLQGEIIEEAPNERVIHDNMMSDDGEEVDRTGYMTIEPLQKDEVLSEYKNGNVDPSIIPVILLEERFPITNVESFLVIGKEQRAARVKEELTSGNISLEHVMELFFDYDGITVEELKSIIKDLPQSVAIINYIDEKTSLEKIYELYKCKLISFRYLDLLRMQGIISAEKFEMIRSCVNREEFYSSIECETFYTRYEDIPQSVNPNISTEKSNDEEVPAETKNVFKEVEESVLPELDLGKTQDNIPVVEISDSERVLLTRILGISPDEIAKISIINSKDCNGVPTFLDGYQIIGNRADGVVIFGKFDYKSPIIVMSYEEAAYFLRSRDGDNKNYIVDDLSFVERLEGNEQVRVIEHDENMGKSIVKVICELSENAKMRFSNDEQYRKDVELFVQTLDGRYADDKERYSQGTSDNN